jgi:histone deacetylase complex subunit SAP18
VQRCPLLLRMFPRNGGHNRVQDFQKGLAPPGELSVHTWMDADLRELADLVKQTQSTARHRDAEMEFALIFPDKRGVNIMRVVRAPAMQTHFSHASRFVPPG